MGITKRKNIQDVPYDLFNKNTADRNLNKLDIEEDNLKSTIHDERINSEIDDLAEIIELTEQTGNITEKNDGSLSYRKGGKTKTVSDLQKNYLIDSFYDPNYKSSYLTGDITEDKSKGVFSGLKSSITKPAEDYLSEGKDIYSTSFGAGPKKNEEVANVDVTNEEVADEEVADAEVGTGGGKNIGDWLEKGVKWVDDKVFGDTKVGNVIEEGVGAVGNIAQGIVTADPTALVAGGEDVLGLSADVVALVNTDDENTDLENWLRTGESGVHTVSSVMSGDIKEAIESGVGTAQQFSKAAGNEELSANIGTGYGLYKDASSIMPTKEDETEDLLAMAKRGDRVMPSYHEGGDLELPPGQDPSTFYEEHMKLPHHQNQNEPSEYGPNSANPGGPPMDFGLTYGWKEAVAPGVLGGFGVTLPWEKWGKQAGEWAGDQWNQIKPTGEAFGNIGNFFGNPFEEGGQVYENGDEVWEKALGSQFAGGQSIPKRLLNIDYKKYLPEGYTPVDVKALAVSVYRKPNEPSTWTNLKVHYDPTTNTAEVRAGNDPNKYTGLDISNPSIIRGRLKKQLKKLGLSTKDARQQAKKLYDENPNLITDRGDESADNLYNAFDINAWNERPLSKKEQKWLDKNFPDEKDVIAEEIVEDATGKIVDNKKKEIVDNKKKGTVGGTDTEKGSLFQQLKKGTTGDKLALAGVLGGSLANLGIAGASRSADLPMKNVYEGVMDEAVNMRKRDIGELEGVKGQAAADVRTRFGRTPDTAMNYQQRRARELQRERAIDKAVRQSNLGYDQTIAGQKGQLAQMVAQGSQMERAGEAQARQIEQANRDAYYSALSQGVTGLSTGVQKIGQDMNINRLNETALKALANSNFRVVSTPTGEQVIYDPASGTYTPLNNPDENNNEEVEEVIVNENEVVVNENEIVEGENEVVENIAVQEIGTFGNVTDVPETYAHNVATIGDNTYYKRNNKWVKINNVTDVTDDEWDNMSVIEQSGVPEVQKRGDRVRKRNYKTKMVI